MKRYRSALMLLIFSFAGCGGEKLQKTMIRDEKMSGSFGLLKMNFTIVKGIGDGSWEWEKSRRLVGGARKRPLLWELRSSGYPDSIWRLLVQHDNDGQAIILTVDGSENRRLLEIRIRVR